MRIIGVFNRDGGTFKTTDMDVFAATATRIFAGAGHDFEARVVEGRNLIAELERAALEADALLAGGGDGTISAAAGIAYRRGIPLAVLPAGTMNLFARSLGVPLKLDAALAALAVGQVKAVDIATANGRPFVHQFSVGLHPKLVKLRETLSYQSRAGKMLASSRAAFGAVLRPPNFTVEIVTSHGLERRRTAGISVSNNPFDEGHLPLADTLDRGVLGIYVIRPLTTPALLGLGWGMLRGKWKSLPEIIEREAREAIVRFPRKKSGAMAVIDGELIRLSDRVELKIHPSALKVIVPKDAEARPADDEALVPALSAP
jgi:diacylglycerol kinase family enzyme